MKTLVVGVLCAALVLFAGISLAGVGAGHTHEPGKVEAVNPSTNAPAAEVYSCPMHKGETSKTQIKCPKCGMVMAKADASQSYKCPMHAEVVSDKPGKCLKCNMALTPFAQPARWNNP